MGAYCSLVMVLVLAFPFFSFSSEPSGYREYQITATGSRLGALQKVKNCIDYRFCKVVSSSIAGGDPLYRFHLFVFLDQTELESMARECGVDQHGTRIVVVDALTKKPSTIQFGPAKNLELPEPIDVALRPRAELKRIFDETKSLIQSGNLKGAVEFAASKFNLPLGGYSVKISQASEQGFCITNHEKKEIEFGRSFFENPCMLFSALRHEAEHVRQVQFMEQCVAPSTFEDHVHRERSAYLNDLRLAKALCYDPDMAELLELGAIENFIKSYLQK
ncbi:MAG: hypothetical protein KGP28_09905 [Bdellovibrionales bacterium]|nr:hypothetical protein [Bdellovibrionales bacterium]